MTARRGEDGYWIQGRGLYGTFDKPAGTNVWPLSSVLKDIALAWS
jgi:hypothetical protein